MHFRPRLGYFLTRDATDYDYDNDYDSFLLMLLLLLVLQQLQQNQLLLLLLRRVCMSLQCLVMLQQWLSQPSSRTDRLRDALGAIGRHDVIAQCITGQQQVPDDVISRQQAIDELVQRT